MTSQVVQDMVAEVTAVRTVVGSAKALLDRLFNLVQSNIDDPEALRASLAELRAGKDELAAAVIADTPAEATEPAPPGG